MIMQNRIVKGNTGKLYLTTPKNIATFENDHNFGFDIRNPENWRIFLRRFRNPKNGKLLARVSKDGDPIAYYVFMIGIPKLLRYYLPDYKKDGVGSYYCLFPGEKLRVQNDKSKSFLVPKYGRID